LDYLYYKELGFELYIHNKYPDYQAIKETYYFPRLAGPVYLSRIQYQIYILTAVSKKDSRSDNSEDTETEVDKKLREAWNKVSRHTTKNKSNIEITGIKNSKPRQVIRIEVPDSDKESEDNRSTELDNKEQVL
jgi:hypothetical protein